MNEKVKALLEQISKDEKLKEEFKSLKEIEDVISKAKELGFELTEEDFATPEGELNEDELANVAGGENDCYCVAFGAGGGEQDDGDDFGCACIAYGQGGDAKNDHWTCWCTGAGMGYGNREEEE